MKSVTFLVGIVILTSFAPAVAEASEWEYKRTPTEEDLGDVVSSRRAHSGEDAYKLFKVKNNYLYEDDKWVYDEFFTDSLEKITFKRVGKKELETVEYKTWNMFVSIAGNDFIKKHIGFYTTYRDKYDPILASVWNPLSTPTKKSLWVLNVNVNAADFNKPKWRRDMAVVLTHEFAHVLTLNATQVKFSKANTIECPGKATPVVTAMGCAYKKSYIAGYATAFWDKADIEHAKQVSIAKDKKTARSLVSSYYKTHTNDFVTRYAATSLEEDIAESFTDFVLLKKPVAGVTEKDKKILYFYSFPELIALRESIRASIEPHVFAQ